jgi:hypothetical protein
MNVTDENAILTADLPAHITQELAEFFAECRTVPNAELVKRMEAFEEEESQGRERVSRKMFREMLLWIGPYLALMIVGVAVKIWLVHTYGMPDDPNWRMLVEQLTFIVMLWGLTLTMGTAFVRTLLWKDPVREERRQRFGSAADSVFQYWREWELLHEELRADVKDEGPFATYWHLAKVRYVRQYASEVTQLMEQANQLQEKTGLLNDDALADQCESMRRQLHSIRGLQRIP